MAISSGHAKKVDMRVAYRGLVSCENSSHDSSYLQNEALFESFQAQAGDLRNLTSMSLGSFVFSSLRALSLPFFSTLFRSSILGKAFSVSTSLVSEVMVFRASGQAFREMEGIASAQSWHDSREFTATLMDFALMKSCFHLFQSENFFLKHTVSANAILVGEYSREASGLSDATSRSFLERWLHAAVSSMALEAGGTLMRSATGGSLQILEQASHRRVNLSSAHQRVQNSEGSFEMERPSLSFHSSAFGKFNQDRLSDERYVFDTVQEILQPGGVSYFYPSAYSSVESNLSDLGRLMLERGKTVHLSMVVDALSGRFALESVKDEAYRFLGFILEKAIKLGDQDSLRLALEAMDDPRIDAKARTFTLTHYIDQLAFYRQFEFIPEVAALFFSPHMARCFRRWGIDAMERAKLPVRQDFCLSAPGITPLVHAMRDYPSRLQRLMQFAFEERPPRGDPLRSVKAVVEAFRALGMDPYEPLAEGIFKDETLHFINQVTRYSEVIEAIPFADYAPVLRRLAWCASETCKLILEDPQNRNLFQPLYQLILEPLVNTLRTHRGFQRYLAEAPHIVSDLGDILREPDNLVIDILHALDEPSNHRFPEYTQQYGRNLFRIIMASGAIVKKKITVLPMHPVTHTAAFESEGQERVLDDVQELLDYNLPASSPLLPLVALCEWVEILSPALRWNRRFLPIVRQMQRQYGNAEVTRRYESGAEANYRVGVWMESMLNRVGE